MVNAPKNLPPTRYPLAAHLLLTPASPLHYLLFAVTYLPHQWHAMPAATPSSRLQRSWLLLAGALVGTLLGCESLTKSRWAMSDPVYQDKYAEGASQGDLPGKLKQAVDARFQAGKSGRFIGAGIQQIGPDTTTGGLEIGVEHYAESFLTNHASLLLFAGIEDVYLGGDVGMRLQTPTRIAPFVGLGTFHGYAKESVPARDDNRDNDDDGFIDEWGEEKDKFSGWVSSVYPEVGVHAWLSPDLRLSFVSRYLITTEGRDADQWWIGGSVAVFSR